MSKKYRVFISVDATVSVVVDANSEAEAKEKAMEVADRPCICHQCSDQVEIGDLIDVLDVVEEGED